MTKWIKKLYKVTESKDVEFWMSHLVVMTATIIGVYLAASVGFKQAIEYEIVKSDKDSYYLRSAMQQELVDNLNKAELWSKDYLSGNARKYIGKPEQYKLDDFVWQTMKESPSTFEVPNNILTKIRRYYFDTQMTMQKITQKNYAGHKDMKNLQASVKEMRKNLLPLLDKNIQELKESVEKYDIKL
jgi:hypothetical protein